MSDLLKLAIRAHEGTSFVPERRGQQYVDGYHAHLAAVRTWIEDQGAPAEMVDALYSEYEEGYARRFRAWMEAKARCMSPMIAGPSKFPTRRMEKRNATEHRRYEDLNEYEKRARHRIARRIRDANRPDDPAAALRADLEKLRERLEMMKACNAIIRRKKLTEHEKVAAIMEATGFGEDTARKIATTPDFAGRLGFPAYELTSVRGKIERAEAKLRTLETVPAEPVEVRGARVEEDAQDDRLRIYFDDVPPEETRAALKQRGFRWSRRHGAWQRQLTDAARAAARSVLGAA